MVNNLFTHNPIFVKYIFVQCPFLGPLHTQAKSRDLVMVRTLDYHPKAMYIGVGKAVLGGHGPSIIAWSANGPCCGTIAYFVGGERGWICFDIIYLKLYRFERTTSWCLFVLESICAGICTEILLKICLLEKIKKLKKKSRSSGIWVNATSWRWARRKFRETMKPYP